MKYLLIPAFVILLSGCQNQSSEVARESLFNHDWKFQLGDHPEAVDPDFDDSGWERLSTAWRINNGGIIGGAGVFDVDHRGFIMIPNRE